MTGRCWELVLFWNQFDHGLFVQINYFSLQVPMGSNLVRTEEQKGDETHGSALARPEVSVS